MSLCLDLDSRDLPLGIDEDLRVEDIESIEIKEGEVTITLLPE